MLAPGAASTGHLEQQRQEAINAQIRVFKWTQVGGKDQLVPTKDVVASPPAVKLGAGKSRVIRVVRRSKSAAAAEESYRLVVDEVPKAPKVVSGGCRLHRCAIPCRCSSPLPMMRRS